MVNVISFKKSLLPEAYLGSQFSEASVHSQLLQCRKAEQEVSHSLFCVIGAAFL